MPVEGVGGLRSGKGQGELSQSSGGRMFVTPPSGRAEGRGSVKEIGGDDAHHWKL